MNPPRLEVKKQHARVVIITRAGNGLIESFSSFTPRQAKRILKLLQELLEKGGAE